MISYVMIGSNDLPRSKRFFDPIFELIGFQKEYEIEKQLCWAHPAGGCKIIVTRPYDSQPALSGNGTMVSLRLDTKDLVNLAYRLAIDSGGKDEGEPGMRGRSFYGAYFRDPCDNKICVHAITQN